ncbi:uncharacterized protein BDR25DRAFT_392019 [Lindgomyces ingoldianus]|uniref:Uncharacterized protein n=1 Tax=Lindgomyces ingoldianus TaxID=673940 RepID=A0ACB6R5B4_9PLEO|nr:uncharacterized protein BDR25DRAFT_392019 [Lindgomyces ingoldianus]KAF2474257.1 hypothetical protein BDR25DRAFT_392019 [Lindgomyces ingoldianus]
MLPPIRCLPTWKLRELSTTRHGVRRIRRRADARKKEVCRKVSRLPYLEMKTFSCMYCRSYSHHRCSAEGLRKGLVRIRWMEDEDITSWAATNNSCDRTEIHHGPFVKSVFIQPQFLEQTPQSLETTSLHIKAEVENAKKRSRGTNRHQHTSILNQEELPYRLPTRQSPNARFCSREASPAAKAPGLLYRRNRRAFKMVDLFMVLTDPLLQLTTDLLRGHKNLVCMILLQCLLPRVSAETSSCPPQTSLSSSLRPLLFQSPPSPPYTPPASRPPPLTPPRLLYSNSNPKRSLKRQLSWHMQPLGFAAGEELCKTITSRMDIPGTMCVQQSVENLELTSCGLLQTCWSGCKLGAASEAIRQRQVYGIRRLDFQSDGREHVLYEFERNVVCRERGEKEYRNALRMCGVDTSQKRWRVKLWIRYEAIIWMSRFDYTSRECQHII